MGKAYYIGDDKVIIDLDNLLYVEKLVEKLRNPEGHRYVLMLVFRGFNESVFVNYDEEEACKALYAGIKQAIMDLNA